MALQPPPWRGTLTGGEPLLKREVFVTPSGEKRVALSCHAFLKADPSLRVFVDHDRAAMPYPTFTAHVPLAESGCEVWKVLASNQILEALPRQQAVLLQGWERRTFNGHVGVFRDQEDASVVSAVQDSHYLELGRLAWRTREGEVQQLLPSWNIGRPYEEPPERDSLTWIRRLPDAPSFRARGTVLEVSPHGLLYPYAQVDLLEDSLHGGVHRRLVVPPSHQGAFFPGGRVAYRGQEARIITEGTSVARNGVYAHPCTLLREVLPLQEP